MDCPQVRPGSWGLPVPLAWLLVHGLKTTASCILSSFMAGHGGEITLISITQLWLNVKI